jgi:glycosyltransferase involved in cell wall biosynthesis
MAAVNPNAPHEALLSATDGGAFGAHEQDPRVRVLLEILTGLEQSQCVFALLHDKGEDAPDVESDIDLAFTQPPPQSIEPVLERLAGRGELTIIQRLHYDVPHGYYYILGIPGNGLRFLHLDCLCDPHGMNGYGLPTSYLLERIEPGRHGPRIDTRREAVYLMMKRAVKGQVSARAFDELRRAFAEAGSAVWPEVDAWFGAGERARVQAILDAPSAAEASVKLRALAVAARRRLRRQRPFSWMHGAWAQTVRKAQRLLRPTGLFIVVVGPDGSGKSTLTASVLLQLARAFRATWRFHWRPGLLPKLGRGSSQPPGDASGAGAHSGAVYGGVIGWVRFIYYWADFVLGYWLVVYPRKAQTTLVVGERYFPDVLVHPQRYGFTIPRGFMRLAARMVPSPDLLIVLEDDAHAIFARKQELSPETIAAQMTAYRQEAGHWKRHEIVPAGSGAAATAAAVCTLVLEACASRTCPRLDGSSDGWRAFPNRGNVKVWYAQGDRLHNALRLYHPYSMSARLVKAIGRVLPEGVSRALFHQRPDPALAARLAAMAGKIREQFADPRVSVSFAAGTPGPHRKFTGQVTCDGRVLAYVKIAHDPLVRGLLEDEHRMLVWLRERGFDAAQLPEIRGFVTGSSETLLALGPPDAPAVRRGALADALDARFLLALGALDAAVTPLAEVLASMQLDRDLEHTFATNLPALPLVREAIAAIERALGAQGVKTCPCHGDYAPWNTLALPGGRLFVIDWEYGRRRAAALNDAFHRIFMPARLVANWRPREIIAQLLDLPEHEVLGKVFTGSGVTHEELPAYLLLYLLRELARKPAIDEFMAETIRYTLKRMDSRGCMPKVLVAAYACEPGAGSEPGVGWNMCQAIARDHETWVITRANNRDKIEAALAAQPNPNLHFRYADLPPWALAWKKRTGRIRAYYYLWQFAAWRAARRLTSDIDFDVAHHVTFVNDYTFSFLAFLSVPFVWGPIGSNGRRPGALVDGREGLLDELAPFNLKRLLRAIDPLFWVCALRASLIVGINRDIGRRFPLSMLARSKFASHPAIGVEQALLEAQPAVDAPGLRVLSVGQLVSIKAFHLTLRAFAQLAQSEPTATLTILGSGTLKPALQRLAAELGIDGKVTFVSFMPRAEALALMRDADVFLFPSFEAAGMVVLEAMAHGLPVVALEGTGPGEMIDEQSGFAIRPGSMDETVERLAGALRTLARDPALRSRMGLAARYRVRDRFLWEQRHRIIRSWYRAAGVHAAPPDRREQIGQLP